MQNEKTSNRFTRILIILLSLLLTLLIVYNFFSHQGEIGNGLLALLALLILLVLSEGFDNLSFGKILSLSRNITEKKEEIKDLKIERQHLLSLLVQNNNMQHQSQSMGISGNELRDILRVIKADPQKVEEETHEKEEELSEFGAERVERKRIDYRKVESLAMDWLIKRDNLENLPLHEKIQLAANDPVSAVSPVFDGFIESTRANIFIEVKSYRQSTSVSSIRESLYQRLMNVFYYQQVKGNNAYLQLVLVKLASDNRRQQGLSMEERLCRDFAPAIDKGLLKIQTLELSAVEQEELMA